MIVPLPDKVAATQMIDYCSANVAPRQYYLHNKAGGKGWSVSWESGWKSSATTRRAGWLLEIEDEKEFTFIALKFGL